MKQRQYWLLSSIPEEFLNFGLKAFSGIEKQDLRKHFIKPNKQDADKGESPQLKTDFSKLVVPIEISLNKPRISFL